MAKGIFVTATGTDVGKTYVSGLIVKKMREFEKNCGYYKPALSGAERVNGQLIPGDCARVLATAGMTINPEEVVSYVFEQAVSPHLASEINNVPIILDKIQKDFSKISSMYDYIVVEGAGGIVCPFNLQENLFLPDVIKALNLDIIIVASAELGTINSTVLTYEYAKNAGINTVGIILNNYDENNEMQRDNKKCVELLTKIPVIATVSKNDINLSIEKDTILNLFKEI